MLNLDELKKEERLSVWGRYPVVDDIFQVELQDLKENYYKYYDDICMMSGGVFDNKTFASVYKGIHIKTTKNGLPTY